MKLEDIGAKAGVSRSTISRVINNDPSVNAETRARVLDVIRKEGYMPNFAARALVTRRTHVIGVMIPQTFTAVFQDPYYFPTLLQGISKALNQRGYAMLLWIEDDISDLEAFYTNIVQRRLMDGLIIASIPMGHPFVDRLVDIGMPLVMVERPEKPLSPIRYVSIDNRGAARIAVEHLVSLGRKRIATITGDQFNADGVDRLRGYEDAIHASAQPYDPALIIEGSFTRVSGHQHLRALVEQNVDGIFAGNDQIAFGVLDAAAEMGIRIPEDIALVGFDDLPMAAHVGLTTIRQPVLERGTEAAMLLIEGLEQQSTKAGDEGETRTAPQRPAPHTILPTQLVIRRSTGGLGHNDRSDVSNKEATD